MHIEGAPYSLCITRNPRNPHSHIVPNTFAWLLHVPLSPAHTRPEFEASKVSSHTDVELPDSLEGSTTFSPGISAVLDPLT